MEPWLDSLSEDWKSEHNSSSLSLPNPTPQCSRPGSVASNASQTRIPHLAQTHAKSGTKAKYLRSRSVRGTPPLKGSTVLVEQHPSKLNVAAQQSRASTSESQRKLHTTTLPRRASSALSDAAQSVQRYTLNNRSSRALLDDDILEWKRRLARGEDIAGDGCDLFGPSRLEGMFKAPPGPQDENQPPTSSSFDPQRLWSVPTASSATFTVEHFQSRSRLPELDIVEEVNENVDNTNTSTNSNVGERPIPTGSLRGLVKQQVSSVELAKALRFQTPASQPGNSSLLDDEELSRLHRDSRTRTMSRQEDLRNEWISPVTLSKQNTIRDRALKDSLDKSTAVLQAKLEQLGIDGSQRPLSRSSDQGVAYGHSRASSDKSVHDDPGADLTSQSLPDDLSMGTQDFISHGGFVNKRRGGFSNEGSFHRRTLSSSGASS